MDLLGDALAADFVRISDEFGEQERAYLELTRSFVRDEVLPVIAGYWERAEFPFALARRMGELGLIGHGSGDERMSPASAGLIAMELSRGDGSLATFAGAQAGLVMRSIELFGSAEQKAKWLQPLAKMEAIGAFALTEPDHGSDSLLLETTAVQDGDEFVLNGAKRWIGNGRIADVVVLWARGEDGEVGGYLVEKGTAGYDATVITGKGSLRAIWQADIELNDARIPLTAKQDRRRCPRSARWQRDPAGKPRDPPHDGRRSHPHLRGHRDDPDAARRTRHHRRRSVHLTSSRNCSRIAA